MSFNVQRKDGPSIIPITPTSNKSDARTKAVEAFMKGASQDNAQQSQQAPVANPTQVSPEELSAIKAPQAAEDNKVMQNTNSDSSDKPSEVSEDKEKNLLSSQYAQLARKEKAIRAKVLELQAKEEAFKAKEAAIQAKEVEYQSKYIPKDKFKSNALEALNEAGLSYDELTSLILSQPAQAESMAQNSAFQKLEAEIKALKEANDLNRKAFEDQQQQSYKQALSQIRSEAKDLLNSDPSLEIARATDATNDVVELIEKTFQRDGYLLSVEEAAREVEDYLSERFKKLSKVEKIKAMIQSQAAPSATPSKQQQEVKKEATSQMKTLTNAVNASKPMSPRERAIAAFKNSLK